MEQFYITDTWVIDGIRSPGKGGPGSNGNEGVSLRTYEYGRQLLSIG